MPATKPKPKAAAPPARKPRATKPKPKAAAPPARKPRSPAQLAAAARNLKHGRANGNATVVAAAQPTRAAAGDEMVTITHAVQPGEDLDSIAAAYGTDADALFAANRDVIGSAPTVDVGMPLRLEVTAAVAAKVAAGATPQEDQ